MNPLEIIFSIILILIGGVIAWKKSRPRYTLSYLETGDPSLESYRVSKKTRSRYFLHSSGIVDLKKHPELLRFKEISGEKEYLVEPWDRKGHLYVKEGEEKAVIFEVVKDGEDNLVAIPCLRTIETILENENNNPLLNYKEILLGVLWDGKRKIINSENLFGIIKYESISS